MITYKIQLKTIEDFRKYINMVEKISTTLFRNLYTLKISNNSYITIFL